MRKKAICEMCGSEYIKTNGKSKYCSDECRKKAIKQRYEKHRDELLSYAKEKRKKLKEENPHYERDRWRKIRGTVIYKRKCVICGKEFETPFPQAITCSKECSAINKRKRDNLRSRNRNQHDYYIRRKYGSEENRKKHFEQVEKKKQQEREERVEQKQKEKEAKKIHGICCVCGKPFETYNPAQKTCSKECGRKLQNAHRDKRIPKEQIVDKDITLEALYKRDSGVCYLCGKKCDWDDKQYGHVGPKYPTIEHIIPISRGGLHSWDNVRLAHFGCNCKKADELPDNVAELIPEDAYKYKKEPVKRKKETAQYTKSGQLINTYESTADASRKTGLKMKQIQNCARGECRSYGGYIWRYIGTQRTGA